MSTNVSEEGTSNEDFDVVLKRFGELCLLTYTNERRLLHIHLAVHLQNSQVYFNENNINDVVN